MLTGPLLLFNPWFVSFAQQRHDVAELLAAPPSEVERMTTAMLGDLFLGGEFRVSRTGGDEPILDPSERSHMQDVGGLVRMLALIAAAALVPAVLGWRRLRSDRELRGRLLLAGAATVGAAALLLGAVFALAFDAAFAAFHALFFEAGSWQFGPDSNLLRFFPQPFWFEMALAAGATIVLAAAIAALLARRDLRAAAP
jgi:integral membrane protein (TIGR01906 family)